MGKYEKGDKEFRKKMERERRRRFRFSSYNLGAQALLVLTKVEYR